MTRFLIIAMATIVLSGCSAFKGTFENRLACSMDGIEAYFVSKYGWLGISAEVAQKDASLVCAPRVIIMKAAGA
jgi:hypothetical protein